MHDSDAPTLHTAPGPVRLLVVDDEKDIADFIKKGLEAKGGFAVKVYYDAEAVLAEYKPGLYDLLLIDIRLPKMSGFELYREIRKRDPQVRICFVTAYEIYYDEFRKVFPKIKVACFVRKPVSIEELRQTILTELARG